MIKYSLVIVLLLSIPSYAGDDYSLQNKDDNGIDWHYVISDLPATSNNGVFQIGLWAAGENRDVLQHLSGTDLLNPINNHQRTRQTAFITTIQPDRGASLLPVDRVAEAARTLVTRDPQHRPVYVYQVRPDNNFFPAARSIDVYNHVNPNAAWPTTGINYRLVTAVWGIHLVPPMGVNEANINGANIVAVRTFTFDNGRVNFTETINQYYMALDTRPNPQGFPSNTQTTVLTVRQQLRQFMTNIAVPACILMPLQYRKFNDRDELKRRSSLINMPSYSTSFLRFFTSEDIS